MAESAAAIAAGGNVNREVEIPCDPPLARFVKRPAALFNNRKQVRELARNAQQELQMQKRRGNSGKRTHCPGDEINITDVEKRQEMKRIVRLLIGRTCARLPNFNGHPIMGQP